MLWRRMHDAELAKLQGYPCGDSNPSKRWTLIFWLTLDLNSGYPDIALIRPDSCEPAVEFGNIPAHAQPRNGMQEAAKK